MPEGISPEYDLLQQKFLRREQPTHQYNQEPLMILAALGNLASAFTGDNPQEGIKSTIGLIDNIQKSRTAQAFKDFNAESDLLESQLNNMRKDIELRGKMKETFNKEIADNLGIRRQEADVKVAEATVGSRIREQKAKTAQQEEQTFREGYLTDKARLDLFMADENLKEKERENNARLESLTVAYELLSKPDVSLSDKLTALSIIDRHNYDVPEEENYTALQKLARVSPHADLLIQQGIDKLDDQQVNQLLMASAVMEQEAFPKPVKNEIGRSLGKLTNIIKKDSESQQQGYDFIVEKFSEPTFRNAVRQQGTYTVFKELVRDLQKEQMPSVKADLLNSINELYLLKIKAKNEGIPLEMLLPEKSKEGRTGSLLNLTGPGFTPSIGGISGYELSPEFKERMAREKSIEDQQKKKQEFEETILELANGTYYNKFHVYNYGKEKTIEELDKEFAPFLKGRKIKDLIEEKREQNKSLSIYDRSKK